jgi:putative ABC transport system substrate-binding protein
VTSYRSSLWRPTSRLAARAQGLRQTRRIGVLTSSDEADPEAQSLVTAFREELGKLGWTEGHNIEIDIRWSKADVELMKRSAQELVARRPDLILTSSTLATGVMLQQTRTIPIVFLLVADPVVVATSRASRSPAATPPASHRS